MLLLSIGRVNAAVRAAHTERARCRVPAGRKTQTAARADGQRWRWAASVSVILVKCNSKVIRATRIVIWSSVYRQLNSAIDGAHSRAHGQNCSLACAHRGGARDADGMEFDLSCSLQLYQYSRSTGISERGHALQSHTQSSAGRLVVLHYGCRASLLPDRYRAVGPSGGRGTFRGRSSHIPIHSLKTMGSVSDRPPYPIVYCTVPYYRQSTLLDVSA